MSNSVRPHRRQPTRLPRPSDSPGKSTGVGCQFLLQCMKVKSESGVAQSCLTFCDPMDCSPPGSFIHGIFQAIYIYNWITCLYTWNNIVNQLYFSKKTNKKRIIGKKISLNGGWASAQHKIKLSYLLSITADTHPYWELQVAAFKYAASISPHGDNWFLVGFQKPWQIKWEFNLILQEVSVGLWVDLICSCQSTANLKLCKDARRFRNLRLSQEIIEC